MIECFKNSTSIKEINLGGCYIDKYCASVARNIAKMPNLLVLKTQDPDILSKLPYSALKKSCPNLKIYVGDKVYNINDINVSLNESKELKFLH